MLKRYKFSTFSNNKIKKFNNWDSSVNPIKNITKNKNKSSKTGYGGCDCIVYHNYEIIPRLFFLLCHICLGCELAQFLQRKLK